MKKNDNHLQIIVLCALLCLVRLPQSGAQTPQDACKVDFQDHYNVSETAPPSTQILTIQAPAGGGVTWSMSISYSQLPAGVNGRLDPYLSLSRTGNTNGDYVLKLNKQLDLEDINEKLGIPLNAITVRLTCTQPGLPDQTYEVFVDVDPVNEYYPEFIGGPFTVDISEARAVGFILMTLSSVSRDRDVRPSTGEIYAYSIEPYDYARFHGKPQDDGREFFNMSDPQKGTIVIARQLDFERLDHDQRTTLWLNVTVTDTSRHTNWTTIKINVLDNDDLSPEFYLRDNCDPQPLKTPPCSIVYQARFEAGRTGVVNDIEPGPIFAHDRDTINNSIVYTLRDRVGSAGVASHLALDIYTGVLRVIKPFNQPGGYPVYIVASEISKFQYAAQTTLNLDVSSSPTTPPTARPSTPRPHPKGSGSGDKVDGTGGGGGGGGGAKAGRSTCSDDNSTQVAIIGLAVLGLAVVGLAVALFVTCMKLRHHRLARVGSADDEASGSSRKSFVHQEVLPNQSPQMEKQRQEDLFNSLPEANGRGNKLPPLPLSGSGAAPNPDVFDGTRSFEGGLGHEFFRAPGKTKVPLLLPDSTSATSVDPIIIDDGIPS